MRIAIGSDHAGWKLKQDIMSFLAESGHSHKDFGCYSEESCDYPDVGRAVAESVASGEYERGILICHTGNGMCMTANKVSGVRAALCHNSYTGRLAREHNDANLICLGQGLVELDVAKDIVRLFLTTPFAGERHERRLSKVMELDGLRKGPGEG
ncbi:MAG: ribose 5-phosphate isomerase B [Dehalococcoidia bacterium]|nr:ribose 5-phosphate isomerase B [Dehalococcoidia bacterium]